jgi:glycoprotein endo-alpha-1,2-mannosidase
MVRWILGALAIYLYWSFVSHATAAPTIGAYYYPWWGVGIPGGHTFEQTIRTHLTPQTQPPAVGLHNSRDANVIAAHIDQSHLGNISMWSLSWWGPNSFEDRTIRSHILPHPRAAELSYTIHYEAAGRLGDFDTPDYSNLIPDFQYLAQHVFSDPNYMRIDGKPVVVMYLSRVYFDDPAGWNALTSLRTAMQQQYGYDPYIIGDHIFGGVAAGASQLDAITSYDVYGQVFGDGVADQQSIDHLEQIYANAQTLANNNGVDFVPGVTPGFNDKAVRDGHAVAARYLKALGPTAPGSVLEAMLEDAVLPHTDDDIDDLILVTSFNEWHEDTQVEATIVAPPTNTDDTPTNSDLTQGRYYEGYGNRYLDILRTSTAIPGDFNKDGKVDGADFLKWQRGELTNPPSQSDLDAWQENFGNVFSPMTATSTGVPEPSSIVLLLVACTFNLPRWRVL